ncbi:YhgE/Pip N-terminal domain-containing protein [Paenibacillus catalpae]|uniref:YhgE/Pip N-terminal domain-containing protein n=1 Tax=Paenibacillus catalpae TaxID=1045775 RepID=A0A1I2GTT0_9BACL|nr:ABC transporter permease [Paenibacillus catalpae]SFF20046.1 YhgE/Pip N-terminal domain-containing protein [Paenibacillus catalpae]
MAIFRQKMLWIGVLIITLVLTVFGLAMMGSVLGTKPSHVPVALVVLDAPVDLPTGDKLAVGEMIKKQLTGNQQLPISWKIVSSEEEAREGLNSRDYYGALVLPKDLSAGVASMMGPSPSPATVQIISNEGMNTQAATLVKQGLGQVMKMVSLELSKSALEQLSQRSEQIPVATASALLAPIQVTDETVHPVGANNASGNAPGLMTQIMWMGSLVTAMMLFLASNGAKKATGRKWEVHLLQPILGIVLVGGASGFLVWMANAWYGMEMTAALDTWLFLWLGGSMFYLLQSMLLNWIGFPAMAILVLLMFFSMPILNMPVEFLSSTTHDLLYSWTPLRFVTGGLREIMYFGGLNAVSTNAAVLWSIAGGCLVLLLAAGVKKEKAASEYSSAA